jgi:hypothetical protein
VRLVSTNPQEPGIFAFGQFAVGVVAIGQFSVGVVAIGQIARGVIAVGQVAVGVFAVGQAAIGLYHGTGMLALAGPRGYGLALHLLPRAQREPPPELPPATAPPELLERRQERGWLGAELGNEGGHARVALLGAGPAVDTSELQARLDAARAEGNDRVHLLVRAELESDEVGYRESETRVRLVAEQAIAYRSKPRWRFSYGAPPKGAPRFPVTLVGGALRSTAYVVVVAIVVIAALRPLFQALG